MEALTGVDIASLSGPRYGSSVSVVGSFQIQATDNGPPASVHRRTGDLREILRFGTSAL
jgi:hypothetical protein